MAMSLKTAFRFLLWLTALGLLSCVLWLGCYFFLPEQAAAVSEKDPTLISDVTGLNPIRMAAVLQPRTEQQIREAILSSEGLISVGGGRFSQGGQTAVADGLQLDMRQYNQVVAFDKELKQIRVQAGMRWRDLQEFIDPHQLSVQVMQTYANFSIGGSVSVNAHGRYIGHGALVHSILALRLMLADGSVLLLSRQQHPELFSAVIGGYGGLGIILDVTLQLSNNVKVQRQTIDMPVEDYPAYFNQHIRDNKEVVFHNADLFPPDYREVLAVSWLKTDQEVTEPQRLHPLDQNYRFDARIVDFVADYAAGKWLRQHIQLLLYRKTAVHWRNYEASYDVAELEPPSRRDTTYGLREYFVPVHQANTFIQQMATVFQQHKVNVINVSIRHALPDQLTLLSWSPQEVFAFVVYYRQGTDEEAKQATTEWSKAMIDVTLQHDGRYYLPYQLSATPEQFALAYPGIKQFRQLKQQYDPTDRFSNEFWQRYLQTSPLAE
jgi:FAD/FMN-containing dehydrogenase